MQIEYSPFAMDIEDPQIGLLKTCRELGVAVVAYSPLGRGFASGQYRSPDDFEEGDFRKVSPRFSPENFPKNLKLVDQLGAFAKKKGCTASQLTLAWLLAQGPDIIPIPGTKKIKYVEENLGALKVHLTDEEQSEIRKAIEATEVHGARYPAAYENLWTHQMATVVANSIQHDGRPLCRHPTAIKRALGSGGGNAGDPEVYDQGVACYSSIGIIHRWTVHFGVARHGIGAPMTTRKVAQRSSCARSWAFLVTLDHGIASPYPLDVAQ